MRTIKKAQDGIKATKDSTKLYRDKANTAALKAQLVHGPAIRKNWAEEDQANKDKNRQKFKGKSGYDANGFPIPKQKGGGKVSKK
jgi:hypothetical protein